ncbi:hypothetical protein AB8810_07940 [Xanthomonas sp. NCPPB 3005]|uniref:hypothetical protein n=1 Tax=Xanthomonas sp. NCPPB 3005 TaxID=3240913 RepID=UPI00351680A1
MPSQSRPLAARAHRHCTNPPAMAPGDVVLVRPDGYIGMTAQLDEPAALTRYLAAAGFR